jgi:TatD DNase family protein
MIIVDSHCHLDMLKNHDDINNIIARAKKENVDYLQTICTNLDNFETILLIAEEYDNVFASVGVHPSEVRGVVEYKTLVRLGSNKKVIGLGETGLDYFYNKEVEHQKMQKKSFEQHIFASQENGLPLIIHTRDAEEDTYNILSQNKKNADFQGLIHCFTGSKEFARKILDLGMYISISGIVTFKNATSLQEIAKFIPLERILVETDSPYLSPEPKRGKINEPSYTRYVVEYIAKLKNVEIKEVALQTTNNFFNLFLKAERIDLCVT